LNDPAFAAVIPTYQREATVVRAIESVLAQTVAPSEVIVVDDGSTDGTSERLREFGDLVNIVVQPQSGSAAARNRGVTEASAEWIAFLDSDDRWEPDHLERITEALLATSAHADLYFRDTEAVFEILEMGESRLQVESLWEIAHFSPVNNITVAEDGSSWVLLPVQPMMVQSSVVRRARYLELDGMWPQLSVREDTHLFFKLGLGRPICAVAGVGARMSDDAGADRLTRSVTPASQTYWEQTVLLYDDVMRRTDPRSAPRRVFKERLASAHWRLARIAMARRSPRATLKPLLASFRAQPLFVPRTVVRRLLHPRPR